MRGRYILLCALLGTSIGAAMIATGIGPGIEPRQQNTPASRNFDRVTYIDQLSSAISQYYRANGPLPVPLSSVPTQICTSAGPDCASRHLIDLSYLISAGNYITGIPHDPNGGAGPWGSGFDISQSSDGTIKISAPKAELSKVIQTSVQL
jgi:hypothetical protein